MVVVTGMATGVAMTIIKVDMEWIVDMVATEVRITVVEEVQDMTPTIITTVAVEVTVNITINKIKIIEVINIKLINDKQKKIEIFV